MTYLPRMSDILATFCPMHLVLGATGHISHCGPTLAKLRDDAFVGRRFLDVFELKRPYGITSMEDLRGVVGAKLHLQFRDAPRTELKAVCLPGGEEGELIFNLSFGISVVDAVRDYALTSADFAPTDLTIEMLYLVEAKSAAMEASRKLNTRLQGAKIAAEEQAFTDTLTGLKNRRAVDHVMSRYMQWDTPFAFMQIDLDWFKAVNDTLGHAAGDHVLQEVARILVEETRDNDTVARVGGDEFVVVLPNALDGPTLEAIGSRIINQLTKPIPYQGHECQISGSIGTSLNDIGTTMSIEEVIDNADVALYASKHAGRGRQTFYSPDLRLNPENLEAPKGRAEA